MRWITAYTSCVDRNKQKLFVPYYVIVTVCIIIEYVTTEKRNTMFVRVRINYDKIGKNDDNDKNICYNQEQTPKK